MRVCRAIKRAIRCVALYLRRPTGEFDVTWRRLRRLRDRGLKIHLAIDGGASSGTWTEDFKRVYPQAEVVCIEPRENAQAELMALASRAHRIQIFQTLIGDREDNVDFFEYGDQSSILRNSAGSSFGVAKAVPMTTLDLLISREKLPFPDLIKLDLQGAELLCLKGASRCMANAQVMILEVLFVPFYRDVPLISEILTFMRDHCFRCYDILHLSRRPLDGALAYGDFLFLREGHPLMADNRWSLHTKWENCGLSWGAR